MKNKPNKKFSNTVTKSLSLTNKDQTKSSSHMISFIRAGNLEAIKEMIENDKSTIYSVNEEGMDAFEIACLQIKPNFSLIYYLLPFFQANPLAEHLGEDSNNYAKFSEDILEG